MSETTFETMAEATGTTTETQPLEIDTITLAQLQDELRSQQSISGALIGGTIVALIWAGITALTGFQIGWMAVGVGFVVGVAVQIFGRGVTPLFGLLGALLALGGCLMGNLTTVAIVVAQQEPITFWEIMSIFLSRPAAAIEALSYTFSPIDLLFYGIALYQGYKFSFRDLTATPLQDSDA
ncbi:hypothetical protein KFU94_63230 [Chloroflexi bacterium TSY]|nr:hypothetical protein [Chloroflexi bacterium TSY]